MAQLTALETLQLRKQLLVARSEIQRQVIALEIARIREATAWASTAADWARGAAPWLMIAAPVAGYLFGRNPRPFRSLAAKVYWGWRLYRQIRRLFGAGEPS